LDYTPSFSQEFSLSNVDNENSFHFINWMESFVKS
jgi:hypothetical protein